MACKIPPYLVKVLKMNGYNSPCTIETIMESDLKFFEKFIKQNLKKIIDKVNADNDDSENFLTSFMQNPESYNMLRGHKIMLIKIGEFTRNKGYAFFKSSSASTSAKHNKTSTKTSVKTVLAPDRTSTPSKTTDIGLDKEQSFLFSRLKKMLDEAEFLRLKAVSYIQFNFSAKRISRLVSGRWFSFFMIGVPGLSTKKMKL